MTDDEIKQKKLDQRKSKVVLGFTARFYPDKFEERKIKFEDLAELIYETMHKKTLTLSKYKNGSLRKQCDDSRARSIEDMYQVAKTYIPGITYEKVREAVVSLYSAGTKGRLAHHYCGTVKRIVHGPYNVTSTVHDVRKSLGNKNILINGRNKIKKS